MLNNVILMGRLTRDPELRYTESNKAVATYTLAVDRNVAKSETKADFVNVVAWEKRAEFAKNHLRKGTLICIEGRLQSRNYEDKSGNKRSVLEVIVDNHFFCDTKKNEPAPSQAYAPVDHYNDPYRELTDEEAGDLPF